MKTLVTMLIVMMLMASVAMGSVFVYDGTPSQDAGIYAGFGSDRNWGLAPSGREQARTESAASRADRLYGFPVTAKAIHPFDAEKSFGQVKVRHHTIGEFDTLKGMVGVEKLVAKHLGVAYLLVVGVPAG